MILFYRDAEEDLGYLRAALADRRLTTEQLDEAVRTVLAFKASLELHKRQSLMPPEEDLQVIGCPEHIEKARKITDKSITLVKNTKHMLPWTPETHRHIIIYSAGSGTLQSRLTPKKKQPNWILAEELRKQDFSVTIYKLRPLEFISPKGLNRKKLLASMSVQEYKSRYDAAIVLVDITRFPPATAE